MEERTGFRVTTPLRTILGVAAGSIGQEQLAKAVAEALHRGLPQSGPRSSGSPRAPVGPSPEGSIMDYRETFAFLDSFWTGHQLGINSMGHERPWTREGPGRPC